ncbi:hypothetical protein HYX14_01345 [Candidatus Woesearchaeota archaeon]|nr:hypothetical protein [Candidatus Woesearchaeota archaeon]
MIKKILLIALLLAATAHAALLQGTIYGEQLKVEQNVLVGINTTPEQKMLAKEGAYRFQVPLGKYALTAQKGDIKVQEEMEISAEGEYVLDVFLIPDLADEEELWKDTQDVEVNDLFSEETSTWAYVVAGLLFLFAVYRVYRARKKYGPLKLFRKKIKEEAQKPLEQVKEELAKEPAYIDKAIEILKKHDGRIHQKELRKEMLYLSEAKVSLIVAELEHKGLLEKIKKGRGNILILKSSASENKVEESKE